MATSPIETAVHDRYAQAAQQPEAALCCPVQYNPALLKAIPAEVIEKDYGCGDPSRWLRPGETVLDLGSGTGKIAFIASQVVGPTGRIVGVDMTEAMLAVARRNAPIVASAIGHANVEFRRGRIQDLRLDLDRLDQELRGRPLDGVRAYLEAQAIAERLRQEQPLIADASMDVVVSNCVLNLVDAADKKQLFREIHRVLRPGGRAVISDIVSDEPVPEHLQRDPTLWSGCISGALVEEEFGRAFEEAGLHPLQWLERDETPWQTVQGIEFRSVTIEAFKPLAGSSADRRQAVLYRGPFREVIDDRGRRFRRGFPVAVSEGEFSQLQRPPFLGHFIGIQPDAEAAAAPGVPQATLPGSPASSVWQEMRIRSARERKGESYQVTTKPRPCCEGGDCG